MPFQPQSFDMNLRPLEENQIFDVPEIADLTGRILGQYPKNHPLNHHLLPGIQNPVDFDLQLTVGFLLDVGNY